MAGYSGKPLAEKLGLVSGRMAADGRQALFLGAPEGYGKLLGKLPPQLVPAEAGLAQAAGKALAKRAPFDFIHAFCRGDAELARSFPDLKGLLAPEGMLWISWPKLPKGRKPEAGSLNENRVREIGLAAGLVDVKVCAVDETWSGLKFVFRVKDRA
jgi:hypothetical protein